MNQADLEALRNKQKTMCEFLSFVGLEAKQMAHYIDMGLVVGQNRYHEDYLKKDLPYEAMQEARDGIVYLGLDAHKSWPSAQRLHEMVAIARLFAEAWTRLSALREATDGDSAG